MEITVCNATGSDAIAAVNQFFEIWFTLFCYRANAMRNLIRFLLDLSPHDYALVFKQRLEGTQ